jgi:type VII secretion integral membrane protein EccD
VNSPPGADLCRVTVVGPSRRVDMALPVDAPFAELFPTMLRYAGQDLADAGLAHGGWVLQKLDEAPFEPASTPQQTGLRDGDMIYLRPRMAQLPELAFDDVPDVVATAVNERPDRWRADMTRRFSLGWGAAALLVGALALLLADSPSWLVPAISAGGVALLLLIGGIAYSRAIGDTATGAVLGYVALPYALLAGLLAPAGDTPLGELGKLHLLAAFGAVVLTATIAGFAIADGLPVFFGIAGAALLGTITTGLALAFEGLSLEGIAAITAAVALALTPLLPAVAFRMARVALPPLPNSAEDLRRDTLMVDGQQVLARTVAADRFVTGGVSGTGLAASGALIPLAFGDGWVSPVMCAALSIALLLRARIFRGRGQKLWLLLPGVFGFGLLAVDAALSMSQVYVVAGVLLPALVVAGLVIGVGTWLPNNRPSPFWGRAGDIVDMIFVVSLIPLALGVSGLYGYIRGLV